MHNVNIEELQQTIHGSKQMKFETGDYVPSPLSSDSGIEGDSDGNLSWLLNYKIHELPPVPGKITINLRTTRFAIINYLLCVL